MLAWPNLDPAWLGPHRESRRDASRPFNSRPTESIELLAKTALDENPARVVMPQSLRHAADSAYCQTGMSNLLGHEVGDQR